MPVSAETKGQSSDAEITAESQGRTIAVVLNRDLLFGSRIRSALSLLGMQGKFAGNTRQLRDLVALHSADVAIVVIDMNGPVEWDALREALGAADPPPTLAFGPHVDVEGRRAAKLAGIDRIVSNGQFDREMVSLIERYRRR